MRPKLPEGLRVVYEYSTTKETPAGRPLIQPHRTITANVYDDTDKLIVSGIAICREGPAYDEMYNEQNPVKYDQFTKQIGRDISLGRARKKLPGKFWTTEER